MTTTTTLRLLSVDRTVVAVADECVAEVVDDPPLTSTPLTPAAVSGLTNHRGRATVVVDLRAALGMLDVEPPRSARVAFVETPSATLGLLVDTVDDTADVAVEALQPAPLTMMPAARRIVTGVETVGDRVVAVLDLDGLLAELQRAD